MKIMQSKKRRKGLKRINTNLKILLDYPAEYEDIDSEKRAKNLAQGIFLVGGKEYAYDIRSLYLFSSQWRFRKFIVYIIVSAWFDYFILGCILANSVNLALYDYSQENDNSYGINTNDLLEIAFTFIFLIEAILKVIGMGLFMHKNSYMREGWNILDFIVVLVSLIEFAPNVPSLKSLRVLRVLRPLRSINAIPSMRVLVSTLLISIPQLGSVVIFLFFIFLLFGIMGINQYTGITYSQ
jgi:hypothetical protein